VRYVNVGFKAAATDSYKKVFHTYLTSDTVTPKGNGSGTEQGERLSAHGTLPLPYLSPLAHKLV
jgi:hypothetical protein